MRIQQTVPQMEEVLVRNDEREAVDTGVLRYVSMTRGVHAYMLSDIPGPLAWILRRKYPSVLPDTDL
jgi:hypothetical protein